MAPTDVLKMQSATVAGIAVSFPQAINVLNRYKLDYCCNGGRRFIAACDDMKLDAGSVWREIMESTGGTEAEQRLRFDRWQTPFLIDYIVQHHHTYVRETAARILELLKKVEAVHSEDSPETALVRQGFEQLADELLEHMTAEEVIVFPAIRRIEESKKSDARDVLSKDILLPLDVLTNEHEEAGRLIMKIRGLTNNYTPPLHACPTFQLTWRLLKEFDEDLMQHIHLENNILFPRVMTVE